MQTRRGGGTVTLRGGRAWLPDGYRAAVAITVDVDAESGVLFDRPDARHQLSVMSHQAYGPTVGVPRILDILRRHGVRATFFVPGFTAERHPDAVRAIAEDGHEIGHHGYLHEPVTSLGADGEAAVLLRGIDVLERVVGTRPTGWRGPMWEVGPRTPGLLARHGFAYDSSLMDDDAPYRLRTGPEADAQTIVEIPVHWADDDGEQYAWLPGIWEGEGIASPRKMLEMWSLSFEAIVEVGGCFVPTIHPFLSGRPSRAKVVEGLIERICGTSDVWVATGSELATHTAKLEEPSRYHPAVEFEEPRR